MSITYRPIIVISSTRQDKIPDLIKDVFRSSRASSGKKVYLHYINDIPFHEFTSYAREPLLDNIDLGVEIYTWKENEIEKMFKVINEEFSDNVGIIFYCDEDKKSLIKKISQSLPNSFKVNLVKDMCK
ncbi:DUF5751 family protein [Sulfuracidifex tepidarius]|uniref:DUF5751 domain-containing protein n=1 Tax=Sulfuracidifex tepidarius TaxID=1294262 RepID=A0A510E6Q8_9CREN|nr:DUF5751 family protein [Sulfuracidifex tepidarius]BBG28194.1 hypothetical protein IC007_2750 [Sulfuracidifex tepidarius]